MNLLVDIGNTRVKWGLARDGVLVDTGVFNHAEPLDWPSQLTPATIAAIFVASVADDSALNGLLAYARARHVPLHRVESEARFGALSNGYANPRQLGADRWLACVAARTRGVSPVLIADAGTALTLDWIDANGRHGGGLIAPGVARSRCALVASTRLRPTSIAEPRNWLARDTDSAITVGTLLGPVALLDGAARRLQPERLLLTGGEAALLAGRLEQHWDVVPELVLEGLAQYAAAHTRAGQSGREQSK